MGMKRKLLKRGFHRCDDTPKRGYPRYDSDDGKHRVTKYGNGWRYSFIGSGTGKKAPFRDIEELMGMMETAKVHKKRRRWAKSCICDEARA